eukprot:351497-Chlamydomonas_euryale.AAC.5
MHRYEGNAHGHEGVGERACMQGGNACTRPCTPADDAACRARPRPCDTPAYTSHALRPFACIARARMRAHAPTSYHARPSKRTHRRACAPALLPPCVCLRARPLPPPSLLESGMRSAGARAHLASGGPA